MPFSIDGMNWRGSRRRRSCRRTRTRRRAAAARPRSCRRAYWPWPPVCFTCRPALAPCVLIVSWYAILAGWVATSTPNLRFIRSICTSRCASPMPYITVSCVSSERATRSVGVLLAQTREAGGELVLVALRLRLDGEREQRLGELDGGQLHRVVLRGEGVARVRVRELRDGADVAGRDLGHVLVLLAPHREQLADALVGVLRGVEHGRVRPEPAGEHAEHGDVADERVRDGLEHERRQRAGGVARALLLRRRSSTSPSPRGGRAARGTPRR